MQRFFFGFPKIGNKFAFFELAAAGDGKKQFRVTFCQFPPWQNPFKSV
jgi:hypothetical protein